MKTPISYYGGKQNLVNEILPLFPAHKQYVEPFMGGGAIYFAKSKSEHEVINDLDNRVVNFYEVLKTDYTNLEQRIKLTLHSESTYKRAMSILKEPMQDKLDYAWAFWVQTNMSFGTKIFAGFAFCNEHKVATQMKNKRENFDESYLKRIELTEIFNRDALALIKMKDNPDTFFYLDPPYVSSQQGHYKGYTEQDFINLLDTIKNIKGKFLLSSYPEIILDEYTQAYGWQRKEITQRLSVDGRRKELKNKKEILTYNYELNYNLFSN